ncbi:unnamed protein product [Arabidopsis arenosa]|uniref:Cysteine/Histidine-rich C1 domain family protein n=1 Tax=Arabidopsis arenosa TaxID=38785 RepID=A0A8S2AV70_ARAAE|nr:unnamed protein product [Arabidopsis arenosa]
MESEGVSLPLIHKHLMMPWDNDLQKGDCCGRFGFSSGGYCCKRCDSFFHRKCVDVSSKSIEHPSHSIHTLKLQSKLLYLNLYKICDLCGKRIVNLLYGCKICDFNVDLYCAKYPPPEVIDISETHHHKLTLFKKLTVFNCDANKCGKPGLEFPYKCHECDLAFHVDCVWNPPEPEYPSEDVWNGEELEGIPEEIEDTEPYVVNDDNTIQHFSHKEHDLRFHVNGLFWEENKRCSACSHPICLQSFYGCIDCDFMLHQSCANYPRKKWHVLHNDRLTLVTSKDGVFWCQACGRMSNGFMYKCGDTRLDVLCGSVSEPFVHPSHPHHPLYYIPSVEEKKCNGCNNSTSRVLTCIESGCGFVLCFHCATLPQVVKHRVDDHPLSLCYGEKASGKYWCDICEKETSPSTWFYTCKDHRASLHTKCVLGDFPGLMPRSTVKLDSRSFEVVLNTSVSRPFCRVCESHCMYPIVLKMLGISDRYICSLDCIRRFFYVMKIVFGG